MRPERVSRRDGRFGGGIYKTEDESRGQSHVIVVDKEYGEHCGDTG